MTMRRGRLKTASCQGGFALVTAIFLLVVLAGLGAAVVNIFTMQHSGSALDLQGARAYQAARAGIEWGMYRQLIDGSCEAQTSFALPPSFGEFSVTVSCTKYPGATPGLDVYQITSNACNQANSGNCPGAAGGVDYVERQMRVSF